MNMFKVLKKKKIFVLLIAMLFVVSFVGCDIEPYNNSTNSEIETKRIESNNKENKIGDFLVTLSSAKVISTYDENVLVVTYSFTNNSSKSKSFIWAVTDKLYQNGIEIKSVVSSYGFADEYDSSSQSKEVQPGETLSVQCAYELNDTQTAVDIEITALFGISGKKAVYSIVID